jgi:tetratricopeptide (TPR) repeat protein
VLFKCLTGRAAFLGEDVMTVLLKVVLEEAPRLSRVDSSIPGEIDDLVARMMAKLPERRLQDAAAVAVAISSLGARGRRSRTGASAVIGNEERRAMSLTLVRPTLGPRNAAGAAETTLKLPQPEVLRAALDTAVATHGQELSVLPDGTLLVAVTSGDTPKERALRAARCALEMAALFPAARGAVVTGLSEVTRSQPVGEVIERGVELLRAEGLGVRVDETTAVLLGETFELLRPQGAILLHREREMVTGARTLLGKPTPCVGRDRDLRALEAFFEGCVEESRATMVVISGPAGIGKSRLRVELTRRLAQRGDVQLWIGRADPMRAGSPLSLLSVLLRHAAGLRDGDAPPSRLAKLHAFVAGHVPAADVPRITEVIAEVVDAPLRPEGSIDAPASRRDPQLWADQLRRACVELTAHASRRQPLVMVLEDVHWGDAPTIELLDHLLRELADRPLFLLAVARPEVSGQLAKLWADRDAHEMRLGALGKKAAETLVREVLGADVDDELRARLIDRAGGNAFHLEELIRAVAEGDGEVLPETVLAMAEARLLRLDPAARRVLRAASVFGRQFCRSGVTALLGDDTEAGRLDHWLAELEGKETIGKRSVGKPLADTEYVFRQALMREAAYAMLTADDRCIGHRVAGQWLERAGEVDAVVLAEHFHLGDRRDRAAIWYAAAARTALDRNDLDAAIARADRAVEMGAGGAALGAMRLLQAEAHRYRGHKLDALRCAEEAASLLSTGSREHDEALGEAATACAALGRGERLVEIADALLHASQSAKLPASRVLALVRAAMYLYLLGHVQRAEEIVARLAQQDDGDASDPMLQANLRFARAQRALYAGDLGVYCAELCAWRDLLERAGEARLACVARGSVGYVHLITGDYARAVSELRDAIEIAERLGLSNGVAEFQHNLGLALAYRGELDESLRVQTEAIEAFRARGNVRMQAGCRIYLSLSLMLAGRTAEAEDAASQALEPCQSIPPALVVVWSALADARLAAGKLELARDAAEQAMRLLESLGKVEEGEAHCRRVHAMVLHATGDVEAARRAIAAAHSRVLAQADKISVAAARDHFLRSHEVARISSLATSWLGG